MSWDRSGDDDDLRHALLQDGFVRVEDALDPSFCDEVVRRALERAGIADDDPTTWATTPRHLPVVENWDLNAVAPAAAELLASLVGGTDRIGFAGVQDNLIVNFPRPDVTWQPPTTTAGGWHKDGDWFRHFLDSPEQALLVIVFWRDVTERQGPTAVAVDSIPAVARFLASHPEGLEPVEVRTGTDRIITGCRDLRPLTGRQGTIAFAHPFLLHTATPNTTGALRIISNSSVMLREPLRFDRDAAFSPVERSILDALGEPRFSFEATGQRGRMSSDRERNWQQESPKSTTPRRAPS